MKHLSSHHRAPTNRVVKSACWGVGAAGILSYVAMATGCSDPAPVGGVSEPGPELVFVRGYRSADDDCKLTWGLRKYMNMRLLEMQDKQAVSAA